MPFFVFIMIVCVYKQMSTKLFQDKNTGQLVEFVQKHDKEYAMVVNSANAVTYVSLDSLIPYDAEKGKRMKVESAPEIAPPPEEQAPKTVVPIEDRRLNLNAATAAQIQKRLPGVGYATAKRIVEMRMSLSGERFANLGQLENIPRVNWEQLIEDDLIFIA